MHRRIIFFYLLSISLDALFTSHGFFKCAFGEERISIGTPVNITEVPYHAAIEYRYKYSGNGAIISPYFVLTSVHVIDDLASPDYMMVRVGSSKKGLGGELYKVRRFISHRSYKKMDYDITVIQLWMKIIFNDVVQPIPIISREPNPNSIMKISGMIDIWENGEITPKMYQTEVKVIPREKCSESYKRAGLNITERMICGLDETLCPCNGYGGSAAAVGGELAGITSLVPGCDPSYPRIFTNLAEPSIRTFLRLVTGLPVSEINI